MSTLTSAHRTQAHALARLANTNPFSDAWTRAEATALGAAVRRREKAWSAGHDDAARRENVTALESLTVELVDRLHAVVTGAVKNASADDEDCALYRELAQFSLYNRFIPELDELVAHGAPRKVPTWRAFSEAFDRAFAVDARARPAFDAAHLFAGCFQLRRAFHHTFRFLVGTSGETARLREAVWEAIFTADAGRYRRALVERMRDVPTLVLGPTGTGKELVARAIGLSGFVPFSAERQQFLGDPNAAFSPVHLQALSPTLVESELFGHKKGAFTGALEDRAGVFAACPPWGAVFFDEIGELDASLQTKLLRVLESRDYTPLGQNESKRFSGRIVAATNRDLAADVEAGRFRRDLYFRLAGVVVKTPSLAARVADDADELPRLVTFLSAQIAGPGEGEVLAAEVLRAVDALPAGYPWPGNVRELAQCVRAVMVNGSYRPQTPAAAEAGGDWLQAARAGALTVDVLITRYVKHVHAQIGTFDGTAKHIGLDRRTVKARVTSG